MKNEIKVKRSLDVVKVGNLLADLVGSFKEGTVCIKNGGEFVTLKPSGDVEVSLEASQKKNKQKLMVELSWRQSEEKAPKTDGDFCISSKEPLVEGTAPLPPSEES